IIAFNDILCSEANSQLVCRNICERIHSEKIVFGISNYSLGQKYCRRCEVYMYHDGMFCPCCEMQLRLTPSDRKHKEILRKRRHMEIADQQALTPKVCNQTR
ncbi:MAG TPA: hypothetical protein VE593_04290, partial [Nitrososphaeraceae archaeon]|nr:hypothetical protein [Nitrososphaeraceae archaeon]